MRLPPAIGTQGRALGEEKVESLGLGCHLCTCWHVGGGLCRQRSFHSDTSPPLFSHSLLPQVTITYCAPGNLTRKKCKWSKRPQKSLKKVLGWHSVLCTGSAPWPLFLFSHGVLSCWWKPTTQLRGSERLFVLELNMNIQGPGTQISVATNTMFQPCNNFVEFYCNRTKRKPRQF